jgi:ribosomal protein L37AE/L43A
MTKCYNVSNIICRFWILTSVEGDAMDQNMNDKITQIAADLFSPPKPGEDWGVRMQRFRDEIKKLAERGQTTFGQFLGILESFRTIIPEEKQRYQAAIQALSATLKLSKDGLLNAVGDQLSELASMEKSIMPAIPGQRNQLAGWDARAQGIQSEMDQLRDRIAQLETEEKGIVTYIAARQQELDYVEKSMQQTFVAVGADILSVKDKILEYTAEAAAASAPAAPEASAQPAPQPPEQPAAPAPPEPEEAAGPTIEIAEPPALDPNFQKPCPRCGGVMNFHAIGDGWVCYACAYEESGKGHVKSNDDYVASEEGCTPSNIGHVPDKTPESPAPIWPGESQISNDDQSRRKKPSEDQTPTKSASAKALTQKKTCPVCRITMLWFPENRVWRCRSCSYEIST